MLDNSRQTTAGNIAALASPLTLITPTGLLIFEWRYARCSSDASETESVREVLVCKTLTRARPLAPAHMPPIGVRACFRTNTKGPRLCRCLPDADWQPCIHHAAVSKQQRLNQPPVFAIPRPRKVFLVDSHADTDTPALGSHTHEAGGHFVPTRRAFGPGTERSGADVNHSWR
jgi:hypothetical protein